jgi:hypothetical protein
MFFFSTPKLSIRTLRPGKSLHCTVGQNHTKAGQNSICASSSNKLVNSTFIFFKPWRIKKGGRLSLRLFMPSQQPVKKLVVATGNFAHFVTGAFRSKSSSKQSRYHYGGTIFGKYNCFIPLYINIVILIAYHVIQSTDFWNCSKWSWVGMFT